MKPMRDVKAIVRAGCVADLIGCTGHRVDGLVVVSDVTDVASVRTGSGRPRSECEEGDEDEEP